MIRLFYWFKGVQKDRIGGPWWARDFYEEAGINEFLQDVAPFLFKAVKAEGLEPFSRGYSPMDIYPPEDAEEIDLAPFTNQLR